MEVGIEVDLRKRQNTILDHDLAMNRFLPVHHHRFSVFERTRETLVVKLVKPWTMNSWTYRIIDSRTHGLIVSNARLKFENNQTRRTPKHVIKFPNKLSQFHHKEPPLPVSVK